MKKPILRSRIITVLLTVSFLPLLIMGVGAWVVFGRLLEQKSLELQRMVVETHARAIESYLNERVNSLRLLASSYDLYELVNRRLLQELFTNLNRTTGGSFIDLGLIDSNGAHLAYVGPYDLMGAITAKVNGSKK